MSLLFRSSPLLACVCLPTAPTHTRSPKVASPRPAESTMLAPVLCASPAFVLAPIPLLGDAPRVEPLRIRLKDGEVAGFEDLLDAAKAYADGEATRDPEPAVDDIAVARADSEAHPDIEVYADSEATRDPEPSVSAPEDSDDMRSAFAKFRERQRLRASGAPVKEWVHDPADDEAPPEGTPGAPPPGQDGFTPPTPKQKAAADELFEKMLSKDAPEGFGEFLDIRAEFLDEFLDR